LNFIQILGIPQNTLINVVIDKENIVVFIWCYETQHAIS